MDYNASKKGNRQKFWIDNETGIVLKTVIYDNDKVLETTAFESVEFPSKIDADKFELLQK